MLPSEWDATSLGQQILQEFELAPVSEEAYSNARVSLLRLMHAAFGAAESRLYVFTQGEESLALVSEGSNGVLFKRGAESVEPIRKKILANDGTKDQRRLASELQEALNAGELLAAGTTVVRHGLPLYYYLFLLRSPPAYQLPAPAREALLVIPQLLDRQHVSGCDRSELVGLAAHALRTPIHGLGSCLTTLFGGYLSRPDDVKRYQETALSLVDRFGRLVDSIVLSARPAGDHLSLSLGVSDLAEVVSESVRLARRLHRGQILFLATPGICAVVDRERIRDLIGILLDNACKYSAPRGNIHVDLDANRKVAILTIRDWGIGIDPDDLPLIFERGFIGRRARVHSYAGSGMGLYVARMIAEAHEGDIRVWSTGVLGEGVQFCVTLPLQDRRRARSRAPQTHHAATAADALTCSPQ
jgi:signal transduction histidine kinase